MRESLKIGVPVVEAGLGVWLCTGWSPVLSTLTASVVLVVFTVALLDLRRAGFSTSCACFVGDRGGVGPLQLARNALLLMLALGVGFGAHVASGPVGPSWRRLLLRALAASVLLLGGYFLLTRQGRRLSMADAADAADPVPNSSAEVAPRMELTDLAGEPVVLGQPEADAQVVVFARGKCPGCLRDRELLNDLSQQPQPFEAVIVCGGDLELTKEFAAEVRSPVRVIADPRWRTAIAWQVTTTPFSVLVDHSGHVRARGELTSTLSLVTPQIEHPILGLSS